MFILLENLDKIYHAINYRDVEWDHFCFDYVCWNFIFFLCFHCHKNCDLKKVYSNGFCLVSGSDDLQVYRYNEEKTLSWLQSKVGVKTSWYTFYILSCQPTIGSQEDDPMTPRPFTLFSYILYSIDILSYVFLHLLL